MAFGKQGAGIGRMGAAPGSGRPPPPIGFAYLIGADGAYLKGADGAYLLGAA
jgi:hypothetical protein